MRKINFLSKSSSQSCGHSSVTLASTVGSPSAHRRGTMLKHMTFVLLFLFTLGIGKAWGSETVKWYVNGVNTTASNAIVNTTLKLSSKSPSTETGVWTAVSSAKSYAGTNGGAQLGSSSYKFNGTITLSGSTAITSTAIIKSIVVKCKSGGSYTIQPKVGGSNFATSQTINNTSVQTKTFTNNTGMSGEIVLTISTSATKYFTVTEIDVTYDTPSCNQLTMSTVTATPGDRTISMSWPAVDNADSYTVTCKVKSSGTAVAAANISSVTGSTTKSCTISNLTNGTEYTWSVMPVGSGTYCAENTPASGDATPQVYYTVTWNNNGSEYTTTQVASGQRPTFPDAPESCDTGEGASTTFYGWTTSTWSGKAATLEDSKLTGVTIYTSANDMPTVTGNGVVYNAVFAKSSSGGSGTTYTLTANTTTWSSYAQKTQDDDQGLTWSMYAAKGNASGTYYWGLNKNSNGYRIESPEFANTVSSISVNIKNSSSQTIYLCSSTDNSQPTSGDLGSASLSSNSSFYDKDITLEKSFNKFYIYVSGSVYFHSVTVTTSGTTYSNFVTSCCESLGTINGSVSLTNSGTSVTVKDWTYTQGSAAAESNINTYDVYLYSNADSYAAPIDTKHCAYNAKSTGVTFTGLSYARTYKLKIGATGKTGYCDITPVQVTTINSTSTQTFQLDCIDPGLAYGTASVTKTYGSDAAFTNTLTNSHNLTVSYAASNVSPAGCVSVNSSTGEVTIHGAGSATITATSAQQIVSSVKYCADNASYTLTVNKADINPTLGYTSTNLIEGQTSSSPTIIGNTGNGTVTYSSSNTNVATVDENTGVVTAVAEGSVTITATIAATTNYKGNTATANFTISAPTVCLPPTFTVAEGTYYAAQSVELTCATTDAVIRYTTDGNDPIETSPIYSEPIAVATTTTIRAKAFHATYTASSVASATYTIQCATPTFSVDEGTYNVAKSVELSTTYGEKIYYTMGSNPDDPTTESTLYAGAITVSGNTTIKAIAVKDGCTTSSVGSATYVLKCFAPTFEPAAGVVVSGQEIALNCTTDGASIYYSTDGNTPTIDAQHLYDAENKPVLSSATTVKAIAVKDGWTNSDLASAAYTIQYSITWKVGTGNAVGGTALVDAGGSISALPTTPLDDALGLCANKFMGWSETDLGSDEGQSAPSMFTTVSGAPTNINKNKTFYAVFATRSGSETENTLTLSKDKFYAAGQTSSGYKNEDITIDGIVMKRSQWGWQANGNNYYLQGKTNNAIYNDTQLGYIKSIAITKYGGTGNIYVGTSKEPTTNGTAISSTTLNYTAENNYTYFRINSTNTLQLTSVVITYVNSNYSYSDYVTQCCDKHDVSLVNNGSVKGNTFSVDKNSVCEGKTVTLSYEAAAGYTFDAWEVKQGSTDITSTNVEGNVLTMPDDDVTVEAKFNKIPITSVTVTGANNVEVGGNITLTFAITPDNAVAEEISWSASNVKATVNENGEVTGVTQGEVVITATVDGVEGSKTINVTRQTKLGSISVVSPKTSYTLNETFVAPTVNANYLYVDNDAEAYSEAVEATFTGFDNQNAGEQTVTVSFGGKEISYNVTVSPWTLYLKTKAITGKNNATTTSTEEVEVTTLASAIDLTAHYVTLCGGYEQVGYIVSSDDVNSPLAPLGLMTEYTPTANEQILYGVFAHTGYTGETYVDANFNTYTGSSTTEIAVADYSWLNSRNKVYPDKKTTGCVKFGSGSAYGYMTTKSLDLSHKFKVSMKVLKYSATEAVNITITADQTEWTSNIAFSNTEFTSIEHEFAAVGENKQITIETSYKANGQYRAYIDDIKIETLDEVGYTSVYDCRSDKTITYAIAEADAEAGATGACEQESIKQGEDYTVCTTVPTWAGHEFAGWSDGETIVSATIENVQSDITLTATWSEIMADEITISGDNLSAGTLTIDDGRSTTLTVTFDPIDTYNKAITWSTDSHYAITDNGNGTYLFEANNSTTENLTVTATTVNGKSASFTLIINEATKLTGLTLNGLTDANTIYTMGGTFSHEGVVVNTTVNMGEAPLNVDATFSTPDMTTSGVKTITVEYTHAEYGYASTTYEITVNPWYVKLYKNENLINDVEITSTSQTVTLPTEATEGWAPKVSGYHLAGFANSIEAVAPNYSAGATYTPTGDATLYGLYTASMPTYTLIGSANDLEIGRSIIIASKDAVTSTGKNYAAGGLNFTQNGENNNRHAVEVTKSNNGNTLTAYAGATEFILMAGKNPGTYALYDPINGKYACAQATGNNYLKLQDELNEYGSWNITPNSVYAAAGSRNYIFFNSSAKVFACYQSTASQSAIAVYQSDVPVKYEPTQDLVVTDEQTLNTVDVDESVNIIVESGGTLTAGSALAVNNLTIQSVSGGFEVTGTSGEVTGSGAVTVSGDIYLEIKLCEYDENIEEENKIVNANGFLTQKGSQNWYCISAPFEVAINDGFFWGDGTQMELNTHFQLFEWDGARRATGSSGWRRTSGNMKAGIAYFIGFDDERVGTTAGMNQNVIKLKAMNKNISTEGTIDVKEYTTNSAGSNYENWNGLGNPRLHHIALDQNVQAFNYNKQTYSSYPSGEYNFVVGTPFFIQSTTDLTIETANNAEFRAPKREVEEDYMFRVRIGKSGEAIADNHVYVRASDNAISSFEEGHDMPTMNGTTASSALIWTENYGMRLAIEEAPLVNNTASYALGIFAPNAGNYTISVPTERENADLYLTYEGAIIWNLSMGAYTMDLNKGITNGYGLLLQAKAPNSATGVDEVTGDGLQVTGAQKVIIDEHVYILRGGQMYDVNGKMVK